MANLKFHLTFQGEKVKDPIIYELGQQFNVVTSIRRANVGEASGWVDLEISGEIEEIEKAVNSLKQRGIEVSPIEGTVIE